MENTRCAICNSNDYKIILTSRDQRSDLKDKEFSLVRCKKCQLVYINPRPTKNEINKFYPENYYNTRFNFLEKIIDYLIVKIAAHNFKNFNKKGRLLDLGCGAGNFLLEMKKMGFKTTGVDISKNAREIASGKGLIILQGELKDQKFPNNYFDIITLWHVFEHLLDPSSIIQEIYRIMKKDGILLIETPNIDRLSLLLFKKHCFHLDLPRHLYHWSLDTLTKILEKNGFKVFRSDFFSLAFPLTLFHSFRNLLREKNIKQPIASLMLLISSPVLIVLTFLSRIIPSKSEIIRIYARKI